jgi:iron(III) transport system substrate-binding protein
LILGAGLSLVLAACSDGGASPTVAPSQAPASQAPASEAPASASPALSGLDEVCAAAVTEGKLVQWHNHSDNYVQVIDRFKAAYPGIEVEDLVLSPDEQAQRILTEISANRPPTPDLGAGGMDVFKPLLDQGAIDTDVDWAALGVPNDVVHSSNNLVRIQRIAVGLGFNTTNHTAADLPNTWEELIDAKWEQRVIVDPRGRPFDSLSLEWGKDATLDYVQRLKDTVNPLIIEGGTTGLVAVAGGEADITTGGRSAETLEQQSKGLPLDLKFLDVIPTLDNYAIPLVGAAHPNAALCYTGWLTTEGQEFFNEVEFKSNDAIPPQAPAGATVLTIDSPEDADAVKAMSREIGRIWTGG